VCCSVLQYVASAQYVSRLSKTNCNILQLKLPESRDGVSGIHKKELSRRHSFASKKRRCNTLPHTATHCNTLQHTATHCHTLQHTATHCNTLQHTATHAHAPHALRNTHCNTLQHTAVHCNTLQHTTTHCNTLQRTAKQPRCVFATCIITSTHCNTLQHTATHCNPLQHTATHCNTLQHTATHIITSTPHHNPCTLQQNPSKLRKEVRKRRSKQTTTQKSPTKPV